MINSLSRGSQEKKSKNQQINHYQKNKQKLSKDGRHACRQAGKRFSKN